MKNGKGREMHQGRYRLGWKVMKSDGRSCCASIGFVYYKLGKKTVPKEECGPLTVFKSYKAAEYFLKGFTESSDLVIKRCVYKKSLKNFVQEYKMRKVSLTTILNRNKDLIPDCKSVDLADWVMIIPNI
jgi:hypothetical protein